MGLFSWFRRPLKVIRLFEGKGGRFRWTARIDGRLCAVCRAQGYETPEYVEAAAKDLFGGSWEYKWDEPKVASATVTLALSVD